MPALAPMLRPLVLEVWDDVGETVDSVLLANDILEELVVVDGAKMYPLRWTA